MSDYVKLDVPWVKQYEDNFCGPACAQMILLSQARVPDNSPAVQSALFEDIKNDTRGGFPLVERCPKRTLNWETFPSALAATMNRRMEAEADTFSLHQDGGGRDSTVRTVRGINGQLASAALLEDSSHWMVVYGWQNRTDRGDDLPSIEVDGQRITDLWVHDPVWDYQTFMDLNEWTAKQYKVECGTFQDMYIVIGLP